MQDNEKEPINAVVDKIIDNRIEYLKKKHGPGGWICGLRMYDRIEKAKRKFARVFSLEEILLLYDVYCGNTDEGGERNILDKHPFSRDEAVQILTRANAIVPFIVYHNLKKYLDG